jgi:hypothetical protein
MHAGFVVRHTGNKERASVPGRVKHAACASLAAESRLIKLIKV